MSAASFLALLGYEAARLHNGDDPALARVKSSPTKSQQSTTSSQQSTTGTDSGGYSDGGENNYGRNNGGNYGGSQGYYTPPATASPSTGSS